MDGAVKMVKMAQNQGFSTFLRNSIITFGWKWPKMKEVMVYYNSAKTVCSGKLVPYHSTRTAWSVKLSFLIYMAKKCVVTHPKMRKIDVCLSVCLQRKVREIGSRVLSDFFCEVRGP